MRQAAKPLNIWSSSVIRLSENRVIYSDPAKAGYYQGYDAITHPGGDQTFTEYKAKEEPLAGGVDIYEAKGRYVGGTGRFKGITGSSTFKQRWTLAEVTAQWETEYEAK